MEGQIKDKIAVVTGGAEGIGFGIVEKFLEYGAKIVVILDINEAKGVEAANKLNDRNIKGTAVFIKCDVTQDLEKVSSMIINTYKKIDVLVNNAGIMDDNNLKKMFETNAVALMEWSLKFWRYMRKDKYGEGGTILNIASIAGLIVDPFVVGHKACNAAVVNFTKSLGHECNYRMSGVKVLGLCAGLTHTSMATYQWCWDEHVEGFNRLRNALSWQKPDAVGKAAIEVLAKDSGTTWMISGGKPIHETPDIINLSLNDIENPESLSF